MLVMWQYATGTSTSVPTQGWYLIQRQKRARAAPEEHALAKSQAKPLKAAALSSGQRAALVPIVTTLLTECGQVGRGEPVSDDAVLSSIVVFDSVRIEREDGFDFVLTDCYPRATSVLLMPADKALSALEVRRSLVLYIERSICVFPAVLMCLPLHSSVSPITGGKARRKPRIRQTRSACVLA
jgi:hypothetical protein